MLSVHRFATDEWQTFRDLRLAGLRDSPTAFGAPLASEVELTEPDWRGRIESGGWFAGSVDGEPVGMVGCRPRREEPDHWVLVGMWVAPHGRGTGVAGHLVGAAVDHARRGAAHTLSLSVTHDNTPAQRLYERCGFAATGEFTPLRSHPQLLTERMVLRLAGIR